MRRLLRALGIALAGLIALGVALSVAARFHDGPLGPFPGGPFRGTVEHGAEPDWRFLDQTSGIDLEVSPAAPRSVHVWVVRDANGVYVPSALAPKKKWPAQVVADPRVRIRVDGKLYERRATRVTDPAQVLKLLDAVSAKYHVGHGDPETTWIFQLDPPNH